MLDETPRPGGCTGPIDLSTPIGLRPAEPEASAQEAEVKRLVDAALARGAGATPLAENISILGIRDLSPEEIKQLPASTRAPTPARGHAPVRAVDRLKTRHHELARLMAAGRSDQQIADEMDVSMAHLYTLRRSPAFQQLLFTFMAARDQAAVTISDQIAMAASLSLEKLMEVLAENDSNDLPQDWLRKVCTDLLDRAGHSVVHKSTIQTTTLSAKDIQEFKQMHGPQRSPNDSASLVIDQVASPISSAPTPSTETVEALPAHPAGSNGGQLTLDLPIPPDPKLRPEAGGPALREERHPGTTPAAGSALPSLNELGLSMDEVL